MGDNPDLALRFLRKCLHDAANGSEVARPELIEAFTGPPSNGSLSGNHLRVILADQATQIVLYGCLGLAFQIALRPSLEVRVFTDSNRIAARDFRCALVRPACAARYSRIDTALGR